MLDGNYQTKIQVGYGDQEVERHEIGDTWIDSDGIEWEQKNGYRIRINNKMANVGIFKAKCKTCNKGILKQCDNPKITPLFEKIGINPETAFQALRGSSQLIRKNIPGFINTLNKILKQNPFDKKVANAMANSEVELTINKNKAMS